MRSACKSARSVRGRCHSTTIAPGNRHAAALRDALNTNQRCRAHYGEASARRARSRSLSDEGGSTNTLYMRGPRPLPGTMYTCPSAAVTRLAGMPLRPSALSGQWARESHESGCADAGVAWRPDALQITALLSSRSRAGGCALHALAGPLTASWPSAAATPNRESNGAPSPMAPSLLSEAATLPQSGEPMGNPSPARCSQLRWRATPADPMPRRASRLCSWANSSAGAGASAGAAV